MQRFLSRGSRTSIVTALFLSVAVFVAPLAGCSSDDRRTPPPPVDDTRGGAVVPSSGSDTAAAEPQKMSTKKKLVILAGAAALYYLYKKHQGASAATGPDGQYYLSKNGRVYYRDAEHRAHWVTPPPSGIQVPETEAVEYRDLQGYDNRDSGLDLESLVRKMNLASDEPNI